ncbi:MAG: hypothetical protein Q9201_001684 [Fulgogasparrea decipioides]
MSAAASNQPSAITPHQVRLPRHRLRSLAAKLHVLHRPPPQNPLPATPITVVAISDTHGTQPLLPPGDLLLHAGDLTQWGTFTEIQAQLTWLAHQPHKHKIVIAGNHDLLLDPDFRVQHPEKWKQVLKAASRGYEEEEELKTAADLDWGDILYLQNTSTALRFGNQNERIIHVYGSPLTPQYGQSAFQHPAGADVWSETIPVNTDILLTHGPPRGLLDGVKKSGCAHMAKEVARARPRLVVFGHIHVGYGKDDRVYDRVGRAYEAILGGWGGWGDLAGMAMAVILGRAVPQRWRRRHGTTTFVNAAVVEGWQEYKVKNTAVVLVI